MAEEPTEKQVEEPKEKLVEEQKKKQVEEPIKKPGNIITRRWLYKSVTQSRVAASVIALGLLGGLGWGIARYWSEGVDIIEDQLNGAPTHHAFTEFGDISEFDGFGISNVTPIDIDGDGDKDLIVTLSNNVVHGDSKIVILENRLEKPSPVEKPKAQNTYANNVAALLQLRTTDDEPIFRGQRSLQRFIRSGKPVSYAQALANITDVNGKTLFNKGRHIGEFANRDGDIAYAQLMAPYVDSASGLVMCLTRGLQEKDFNTQDTPLPNAVYQLPGHDDGTFRVRGKEAFRLEDHLQGAYDTWFIVTSDKNKFYAAAEKIPDVKLLAMCGHGPRDDNDPSGIWIGPNEDTSSMITKGDQGLLRVIKNLDPDAVIYAEACGRDGKEPDGTSFVKWVAENANGRKVLGAKQSFWFNKDAIQVQSVCPLDVKIMYEGKDITERYN